LSARLGALAFVIASGSEAIHLATRKLDCFVASAPRNDDGFTIIQSYEGTILMKIPALPFTVTDWSKVAATTHGGETGQAIWHTLDIGDLRIRMVEYSPGYLADHWCDRGHVLYVVEGELDTELRDGRAFKLKPGMSYQVSDFGDAAHRSSTKTGAKLFIVD
jgi:hypothetical protein